MVVTLNGDLVLDITEPECVTGVGFIPRSGAGSLAATDDGLVVAGLGVGVSLFRYPCAAPVVPVDGGFDDQAAPVTELSNTEAGIGSVFPNPANPEVEIAFHVVGPKQVTVEICDARGHRITMILAEMVAGPGTIRWDGRDGFGRLAASGLYLIRMSWDGGQDVAGIWPRSSNGTGSCKRGRGE